MHLASGQNIQLKFFSMVRLLPLFAVLAPRMGDKTYPRSVPRATGLVLGGTPGPRQKRGSSVSRGMIRRARELTEKLGRKKKCPV
jgi:hypothetical protein